MPDGVHTLHAPKMTQPVSDDDPSRQLVHAIVRRAIEDACGNVMYPGSRPPDRLEVEARTWLLDPAGLAALLELAGYDAAPVLRRVRELLTAGEGPR